MWPAVWPGTSSTPNSRPRSGEPRAVAVREPRRPRPACARAPGRRPRRRLLRRAWRRRRRGRRDDVSRGSLRGAVHRAASAASTGAGIARIDDGDRARIARAADHPDVVVLKGRDRPDVEHASSLRQARPCGQLAATAGRRLCFRHGPASSRTSTPGSPGRSAAMLLEQERGCVGGALECAFGLHCLQVGAWGDPETFLSLRAHAARGAGRRRRGEGRRRSSPNPRRSRCSPTAWT